MNDVRAGSPARMSRGTMEVGAGTPWEDRGSQGVIVALVRTIFGSMFSPARLLHSIRRPETYTDGRGYAIACGLFWGLSWLIHDVIRFTFYKAEDEVFELGTHGVQWAIHLAIGVFGTWLLLSLITRLLHSLLTAGGTSASVRAPQVLIFNVLAYCLGPSILAMLPLPGFLGPAIAVLWITGLAMFAQVSRLNAKPVNAFVCTIMSFAACLGGAFFGYRLLLWLLRMLGYIQ